nr:hypothetical protein [Cardiobacterium valvarum]
MIRFPYFVGKSLERSDLEHAVVCTFSKILEALGFVNDEVPDVAFQQRLLITLMITYFQGRR